MAGGNGTNGNGKAGGNGKARGPGRPLKPNIPHEDLDPPDLDAEIRKAFFEVLADSNDVRLACRIVGIDSGTFYKWVRRGRKDREGRYFSFARMVDRARAEWERRQIDIIRKAAADYTAEEDWAEQWTKGEGPDAEVRSKVVKRRKKKKGDWRAAAFLLERKFPRRWGPRQQVEVEGKLDLVDVLTQLRDEAEQATQGDTLATPSGAGRANVGEG